MRSLVCDFRGSLSLTFVGAARIEEMIHSTKGKKRIMAKTFDIPFSGEAASVFQHAKHAADEAGATLKGDENRGTFSGKGIEGNYEVSGQTVHVTVTQKPAIVSDSAIESRLREFFEQG